MPNLEVETDGWEYFSPLIVDRDQPPRQAAGRRARAPGDQPWRSTATSSSTGCGSASARSPPARSPPPHASTIPSVKLRAYDSRRPNALLDEAGLKPDANGVRFKHQAPDAALRRGLDAAGRIYPHVAGSRSASRSTLESTDAGGWARRIGDWDYETIDQLPVPVRRSDAGRGAHLRLHQHPEDRLHQHRRLRQPGGRQAVRHGAQARPIRRTGRRRSPPCRRSWCEEIPQIWLMEMALPTIHDKQGAQRASRCGTGIARFVRRRVRSAERCGRRRDAAFARFLIARLVKMVAIVLAIVVRQLPADPRRTRRSGQRHGRAVRRGRSAIHGAAAHAVRPGPAAVDAAVDLRVGQCCAATSACRIRQQRTVAEPDPGAAAGDAAADRHRLRLRADRRHRARAPRPRAASAPGPTASITVLALGFYATPIFWVGLMLVLVFSVWLDWLPSFGMNTVGADLHGWAAVADTAQLPRAAGADARAVLHGGLCAPDPRRDAGGRRRRTSSAPRAPRACPRAASCAATSCATRCCR